MITHRTNVSLIGGCGVNLVQLHVLRHICTLEKCAHSNSLSLIKLNGRPALGVAVYIDAVIGICWGTMLWGIAELIATGPADDTADFVGTSTDPGMTMSIRMDTEEGSRGDTEAGAALWEVLKCFGAGSFLHAPTNAFQIKDSRSPSSLAATAYQICISPNFSVSASATLNSATSSKLFNPWKYTRET